MRWKSQTPCGLLTGADDIWGSDTAVGPLQRSRSFLQPVGCRFSSICSLLVCWQKCAEWLEGLRMTPSGYPPSHRPLALHWSLIYSHTDSIPSSGLHQAHKVGSNGMCFQQANQNQDLQNVCLSQPPFTHFISLFVLHRFHSGNLPREINRRHYAIKQIVFSIIYSFFSLSGASSGLSCQTELHHQLLLVK